MHLVPNGEVYNCSRKTSVSKKDSRCSICSPTQKALYLGVGGCSLDHQPSHHKTTGEGSWFSVVVPHTLQPFQSPPRATKRSYDLHSTPCLLVIPGPLARLQAGDAVCSD